MCKNGKREELMEEEVMNGMGEEVMEEDLHPTQVPLVLEATRTPSDGVFPLTLLKTLDAQNQRRNKDFSSRLFKQRVFHGLHKDVPLKNPGGLWNIYIHYFGKRNLTSNTHRQP